MVAEGYDGYGTDVSAILPQLVDDNECGARQPPALPTF